MFKIFVSDLDGCITAGKARSLDHASISKIFEYNKRAYEDSGLPPLTLITGRPQPYVEAILYMIGGFMPSVCENGAVVYLPKEDVIKINPEINEGVLDVIAEIKEEIMGKLVLENVAKMEPGKEICISLNPTGTTPENGYQKIEELYKNVVEILKGKENYVNITYSKSAVDITPRGIDKYSGLKMLSSMIDVPISQMVGIGDSKGDLSFLENVGYAACPSNALPDVKKIAKYTSRYADAKGVFDIILHVNKLMT